MSTRTSNLSLVKPELTDPADITAMNPNWDTIDSKLAELQTLVASVHGTKKDFTLLANGWKGEAAPYRYDFATTYPEDEYDIEIIPLSTYTAEQREAIMNAYLVGADNNNFYAWGEKPSVDIPIKVKVIAR